MYDILFVNPPLGSSCIPVGIGQLVSVLIKNGFKVKIVDAAPENLSSEKMIELINTLKCRIVGFTGLWSTYQFIKEVSIGLKKTSPEIFQIAGGWWAQTVPEFILTQMPIDIVALGESDELIIQLCEKIIKNKDYSTLNGIAFNSHEGIKVSSEPDVIRNLDDVPYPSYENFDMSFYVRKISADPFIKELTKAGQKYPENFKNKSTLNRISMYSGRGCYGSCTFCSAAGLVSRKYSPKYVVEHMKLLKERYNVDLFYFNESLTLSTPKWVKEFCEELIKEKLGVLFKVESRADFRVTDEIANLLKESGCYSVALGFESGSQKMLDSMKKNVKVETYYKVSKIYENAGIQVHGTIVLNMPGETKDTLKETIDFVKKVKMHSVAVSFAAPYPGTELFQFALDKGFIKDIGDIIEKNPGKGKGMDDFDTYYSHFNFNGIPKDILLYTRQKIFIIVKNPSLDKKLKYYLSKIKKMILRG